jgi:hypothetical protein
MRAYVGLFALIVSACTSASTEQDAKEELTGRLAPFSVLVALDDTNGALAQTSSAEWSLSKTGVVNASADTVTWTITASKLTTSANQLSVSGCLKLVNLGDAPATMGNMVVNLQAESKNTWTTKSSDVANATQGAAATTALVDPYLNTEQASEFSTGSASGLISLTSPCGGSAFSLDPEHSVAPGGTQELGFTATYNNNVLALATGSTVRTEILVSYGNALQFAPPDVANVKINGGSALTPDEAWVSDALWLQSFKVPAPTVVGSNPTIGDSANNITTTGTVTFSNPVFNLGATTGTVTVDVSGGTGGGTIENCATLTGSGVNLSACDTEQIAAVCTPGTNGCPWQDGDVITFDQGDWGGGGSAAATLTANFNSVYASSNDVLTVGVTTAANQYYAAFTSAAAIEAYQPPSGPAAPFTMDLTNPTNTSSGVFGGDVLALDLNIAFSAAGVTSGSLGVAFGNLTLCNLTATTDLNGLTVSEFLGVANTSVSGGATTDSLDAIDAVTESLDGAFEAGTPSSFAQASLFNGPCP